MRVRVRDAVGSQNDVPVGCWTSQDRRSVVNIAFPRMNPVWSGKWPSWESSAAVTLIAG